MANLVIFFQFASNPILKAEFDKDIQALLFGVIEYYEYTRR